MRVQRVAAIVGLVLAAVASAQDAGAPATPPPAAQPLPGPEPPPAAPPLPGPEPPAAPAPVVIPTAGGPRHALHVHFTAGLRAGSTEEAEKHGRGAGGVEVALLVGGRVVQGGLRLGADANGEEVPWSLLLTLGVSLPLSERVRLDLHGDAGPSFYSKDGDSGILGTVETTGSSAALATAALRAGFAFTTRPGWYATLGVYGRVVGRRDVSYRVETCVFLGGCTTEQRQITYGGATFGAFLTLGFTSAVPRSVRPAGPAGPAAPAEGEPGAAP